ncbi:uncharacterized protein LOC114297344 isoform X2 [Camellia sinensis]|uniref:uncharacterized protein LOC114297344 isoform X2 n=1 Tax=Camellia sinensis TaxID=4442 RepID=UPI0010363A75|nr:uncharacterized protein LOC114297344 isoform X2 [Camellia sinensis]
MECCGRPNRSDIHLSKEEEAKMEEETREYFDGLAPKRHAKPQRSDYSSQYVDILSNCHDNGVIPEQLVFQQLQHHDSQTGTGFITVENANGMNFNLASDTATDCHASCKANPATNDWIPAANDTAAFVSDKPKRSDN